MSTTPVMPNRAELIRLCLDGAVPEPSWTDRDSARAHMQLGSALMLLQAGCDYYHETDQNDNTYHITIYLRGFTWFEGSLDPYQHRDELLDREYFYIPTRKRLQEVAGGDWYC